jgi:hypothetical protein
LAIERTLIAFKVLFFILFVISVCLACTSSATNNVCSNFFLFAFLLSHPDPPTKVTIRADPETVQAGRQVQLTCESAASNPPAELSWWSDGQPMIMSQLTNATQSELSLTSILLNTSDHKPASVLRFQTNSAMNGRVFTCQAGNSALKHTVHDTITLNVQCKCLSPDLLSRHSSH